MNFTFINLVAMSFDTLLIIPEMIHTVKGIKKTYNGKKIVIILDYVYKYACLILMFLPLGISEFGFKSVAGMLIYLFGNIILCLVYDVMFVINVKQDSYKRDVILLYISLAIYLLSAFVLRHYLLLIATLAYGIIHLEILKARSDQYMQP